MNDYRRLGPKEQYGHGNANGMTRTITYKIIDIYRLPLKKLVKLNKGIAI
jgi:hypothetical protein